MEGKKVLTERLGSTFLVMINRPEVRNAVDAETAIMLSEAVEVFRKDESLRVLILTGQGEEAFCSGFDLKFAYKSNLGEYINSMRQLGPMGITRILDLDKPTIAAINGYCVAGGLELACWCDFRICDRSAKFGVLNRRWGVPLIDGGSQRLPRIIGLSNALYLIETGVLIDSQEALRMGLVQEVVADGEALKRALVLAEHIASYPQDSLRNDRMATLLGSHLPLAEGLAVEAQIGHLSLLSPELRQGVESYIAGKKPDPLTLFAENKGDSQS